MIRILTLNLKMMCVNRKDLLEFLILCFSPLYVVLMLSLQYHPFCSFLRADGKLHGRKRFSNMHVSCILDKIQIGEEIEIFWQNAKQISMSGLYFSPGKSIPYLSSSHVSDTDQVTYQHSCNALLPRRRIQQLSHALA